MTMHGWRGMRRTVATLRRALIVVAIGLWPQVTVAELDSELTARTRAVLPCLEHRRDDVFGPADPAAAVGLAGATRPVGATGPAGAAPRLT